MCVHESYKCDIGHTPIMEPTANALLLLKPKI